MSKPNYERLISLEDEELSAAYRDDNDNNDKDKDSFRVPKILNGSSSIPTNRSTGFNTTTNKIGSGVHFSIGGFHIHLNTDQLKYLSLITLTVQNAALNLTMRAARTQEEKFSTSVAVTVAEVLKLITCLLVLWFEETTLQRAYLSIKTNILDDYWGTLKVAVPSLVYYVQNNLLYVGSTHLDAATGQVIYQLKILTTAVFSVFMLGKRLTKMQWVSLIVLFCGVAMIEALAVRNASHSNLELTNTSSTISSHKLDSNRNERDHKMTRENPTLGFIAILIACCLSGFAGVYFERILKSTGHISLWIRNIQLSVLSIPFGLIQVFIVERDYLYTKGLGYGFTPLTWLCIALQVQGGLLVALVVKFANNILKGFATSLAILISTMVSMIIFDFTLTGTFVIGASLVIGSVMMYNKQ